MVDDATNVEKVIKVPLKSCTFLFIKKPGEVSIQHSGTNRTYMYSSDSLQGNILEDNQDINKISCNYYGELCDR